MKSISIFRSVRDFNGAMSSSRWWKKGLQGLSLLSPICHPAQASELTGGGLARRHGSSSTPVENVLKEWNFDNVNSFGRFIMRAGPHTSYKISPLNPQLFPHQNIARVSVATPSKDLNLVELDDYKVECYYEADDKLLSLRSLGGKKDATSNLDFQVEVPLTFDLDLKVGDNGQVSVDKFENQDVNIEVDQGDCLLKDIKSGSIQVHSNGGHIRCRGLLQGNTLLQASQIGNVHINKPLCQHLLVESDQGHIEVTSLYATSSHFKTNNGNVHLGSCHGSAKVVIKKSGNLSVDTLDGDLHADVNQGHIKMHVTRHQMLHLVVGEGDIDLRISDGLPTTFDLRGSMVTLDPRMPTGDLRQDNEAGLVHVSGRVLGDQELPHQNQATTIGHVIAHTKCGHVKVACQDWLSSLNLGKSRD